MVSYRGIKLFAKLHITNSNSFNSKFISIYEMKQSHLTMKWKKKNIVNINLYSVLLRNSRVQRWMEGNFQELLTIHGKWLFTFVSGFLCLFPWLENFQDKRKSNNWNFQTGNVHFHLMLKKLHTVNCHLYTPLLPHPPPPNTPRARLQAHPVTDPSKTYIQL